MTRRIYLTADMVRHGTTEVRKEWARQSDAQLVLAARGGEKAAFVEIVSRHQTMVYGVAFGILNDFAASEDAAQEAFLTAWRKLPELREPQHLRAWLAQIGRNAALSHKRWQRPEQPLGDDLDLADPSRKPDEAAASEEENLLVRDALEKLPEPYRVPLVLYYCEGQSVHAVAGVLAISEDATRQRIARGREMLRSHMERVVESVLNRRRPNAIFTMTVAAAIGAFAAPSAVAAAAFGSSSTLSPLSSMISAMGASKPLATAAVMLIVVGIPVGYQLGSTPIKPGDFRQSPLTNAGVVPAAARPSFEESTLFAEWRALLEVHGSSAESMPAIYKAIQELKDPLRRSAFTTALFAEWTQLDPLGAAAFLSEKSRPQREREQFFREWFAAHPRQALVSIPETKEWLDILRDSLKEVAERVPDMLASVVERLPQKESFYDASVRDAFRVLAERDLDSARALAMRIGGPNQGDALAGIAQVWARTDLDATIAWAKEQKVDTDEIIRSALVGVASTDPVAALDRIASVAPGGREAHGNSTTGARVLQAAARADFETTVAWLKGNPSGLSREDLLGLRESVTEKLIDDATGFLTRHSNDGSITVLVDAIESALMNDAAGLRPAVWDWLNKQPSSDTVKALRTSILDISAWHDPPFALELVRKLPATPEGDADVKEVARALLNGGHELQRFEKLYATAPDRLRAPLVEQAFEHLSAEYMQSAQLWLGRVALLPEHKRAEGMASIARAWATEAPEEAALWALSLPSGEARVGVIAKIAAKWATRDQQAAANFLQAVSVEERLAGEAAIQEAEKR